MNILKKLVSRSGKVALSALQAVGLTAVVGVAGVAAYQFLGTSSEDNTAFNPVGQYNPGEIVYVSNANTGSYAENAYRGKLERSNGEPSSSVRVSAKTLRLLENQEMAERAAQEMAENESEMAMSAPMNSPAYELGQTEGLGMGANAANEQDLANSPMGAMTKQMADIKSVIANAAQQQTQANGQDGKGGKNGKGEGEKGAPSLASATPNWRSGSSSGGGANGGGGSSFVLQNSGKNAQKGMDMAGAKGAIEQAQKMMNGVMEGSQMKAKASFGRSAGMGKSKDATVMGGRAGKQGKDDLEFFSKRSMEVAANRDRHNTEANVFLASTQISGGLMINAEHVNTGEGKGSKDFSATTNAQVQAARNFTTDPTILDPLETFNYDQLNLILLLLGTIAGVYALCKIIFWLANAAKAAVYPANIFLWIAVGIVVAAGLVLCGKLIYEAVQYAQKYGGGGLSTMAGITGCVGCAALVLSLLYNVSDGVKNAIDAMLKIFTGVETGAETGSITGAVEGAGGTGGSSSGMFDIFMQKFFP